MADRRPVKVAAAVAGVARPSAVLAMAVLMAACSAEAATPNSPRIHRVSIIRDSFTERSGEGGLGSRSWPEVLRHDLLAEKVAVLVQRAFGAGPR